jgi:hypothetical protein
VPKLRCRHAFHRTCLDACLVLMHRSTLLTSSYAQGPSLFLLLSDLLCFLWVIVLWNYGLKLDQPPVVAATTLAIYMATNWAPGPLKFYISFQFRYWLNVNFIGNFLHCLLILMEIPVLSSKG